MKVLILYTNTELKLRKTIYDHLYCFRDYVKDVEFHYCNVMLKLPFYLRFVEYDGIILHYTLLSAKWTLAHWYDLFNGLKMIKKKEAVKVAMPQDEYIHSNELCRLFKEYGIETIYTCSYPVDYQKLYPEEKSGIKYYFTTYTGFVDENTLKTLNRITQDIKQREIDVGYRARKLPYWLGSFGRIKYELAIKFNSIKHNQSLNMDVSTDPKDVFYGNDWLRFILSCRTMLGCLGGASMHDPDGKIREKVEFYTNRHPNATFKEVEHHCFKGKDNTLQLFALSPRHFECAMAKTCQVLVEGDYNGVLEPGVHFIELKKDFSNIEDVLKQIENKSLCEKIAERAYKDIVASGKYTYRKFAVEVISHIRKISQQIENKTSTILNDILFRMTTSLLDIRKKLEKLHRFGFKIYLFYRFRLKNLPNAIKKRLRKIKFIYKKT